MSTVAEIEAVLPTLTLEELRAVEVALHHARRQRGDGVIFDDDYGVWAEDDQAASTAEAWAILDGASPSTADGK